MKFNMPYSFKTIRKVIAFGIAVFICCQASQTLNSKARFPLGSAMLDLFRSAFSCARIPCPGQFFMFGHYALDELTSYEDIKLFNKEEYKEECPGINMYHILYFGACLYPCNATSDCSIVTGGDNSTAGGGWHCCPVRDLILNDRVEMRCIPHT